MKNCVILLHGMARTHRSLRRFERALNQAGFVVFNVHYPSRRHTIEGLAKWLNDFLHLKSLGQYTKVHFVGHSLGGLLARRFCYQYPLANMGCMVQLGSPNQGSELADKVHRHFWYRWLNGPVGQQLTTQYPLAVLLGQPNYPVGVIAGNLSLLPGAKKWIFQQETDGFVSVASTHCVNQVDHITLSVDHSTIMYRDEVIRQAVYFLQHQQFDHKTT